MHCLMVLYPQPDQPDAFKKYYKDSHLPLAQQLPGIRSYSYGYPEVLGETANDSFCVFQAMFEDVEAMARALDSEIGQRVAADVPNYSPKGATLLHFDLAE